MKGIWSKLIKNNNSTAGFRSDVNKGDELPEVLGKDGSTKDAKRKEVQYQYTPEGKLITTNLSNLELFQDFKKWVTPKDTKDFRGEDFEAVFNGSEAIDEMMKKWDLKDRNDGLEIGKAFVEGIKLCVSCCCFG